MTATTSGSTSTTTSVNSNAYIWIIVAMCVAGAIVLTAFVAIVVIVLLRCRRRERDEEADRRQLTGSGTEPLLGNVEAVEKSTSPDIVAVSTDLSPPSDKGEKHYRQIKTPAFNALAPSATSITETTDATQLLTDKTQIE
uniref:Uncharacterized protein n=1 Tax=Panagrellus redivivus TaxID=6233 RepID=A0A7E4ZZ12_PANRE